MPKRAVPQQRSAAPEGVSALDVRTVMRITESFRVVRILAWGGVVALCLYVGVALPVKYSGGKVTTVTLAYNFISDLKVNEWVAYCVAGLTSGLWLRERRLRKSTVTREHVRLAALEAEIDRRREGSGFTE